MKFSVADGFKYVSVSYYHAYSSNRDVESKDGNLVKQG
ncbi:hypothetical protein AVEN_25699-1, partial [Araneus ventricosus]